MSLEILLTSSQQKADQLSLTINSQLKSNSVNISYIPLIQIIPIQNWQEFDKLIVGFAKIDGIILTSQYTVTFFLQRLKKLKINLADLKTKKWLVIGEQTKLSLKNPYFSPLIPKMQNSSGLISLLKKISLKNYTYIFPCSKLTDNEITNNLSNESIKIKQIAIYDNILPKTAAADLITYLKTKTPNWIIFSSPSTFRNFQVIIQNSKLNIKSKIAVIGETTANFIAQQGHTVDLLAKEKNLLKLINSIIYLNNKEPKIL